MSSSLDTKTSACVAHLIELGFSRDIAKKAAKQCHAHIERATELILSGELGDPTGAPAVSDGDVSMSTSPRAARVPASSSAVIASPTKSPVYFAKRTGAPAASSPSSSRPVAAAAASHSSSTHRQPEPDAYSAMREATRASAATRTSPSPYPSSGGSSSSATPPPPSRSVPPSPARVTAAAPTSSSSRYATATRRRDDEMEVDDASHTTTTTTTSEKTRWTQSKTKISTTSTTRYSTTSSAARSQANDPFRLEPTTSPYFPAAANQSSFASVSSAPAPAAVTLSPSVLIAQSLLIDSKVYDRIQPFLATLSTPDSLSVESIRAHAELLGTRIPLGVNSFIDLRDKLGKFLAAQVLSTEWIDQRARHRPENVQLLVHYLHWGHEHDENVRPKDDPLRIHPFRTLSAGSEKDSAEVLHIPPNWVAVNQHVVAYHYINQQRPYRFGWYCGRIAKCDGPQVMIDFYPTPNNSTPTQQPQEPKRVQRWYHSSSDLIMPIAKALELYQQHTTPVTSPVPTTQVKSPTTTATANTASNKFGQSTSSADRTAATSQGVHSSYAAVSSLHQSQHQSQHPSHHASAASSHHSPFAFSSPQGTPRDNFSPQHQLPPTQYGTMANPISISSQNSFPLSHSHSHSQQPLTPSALLSPTDMISPPTAARDVSHNNPPNPTPTYFVGQFLEVKDTVGKFLPAEILKVDSQRIFVRFEGWSERWNLWVDTVHDAARIRPLGAMLADSAEEKLRKEEDIKFRQRIAKEHGYTIFECERDGNCLFRAWSHQVYGSVDRHAELRARCYDYIERDRDYFSAYITEDFDAYIAKQRLDGAWGDNVEIVALREMMNANVEIYNYDSITGCQPIGTEMTSAASSYKVPIVRLSFHGRNHYNSVVDPKNPPPLGDGSKSPINMRNIRQQQSAAEASEAKVREIQAAEKAQADARVAAAVSSSSSSSQSTPSKPVRSSSFGRNMVSPSVVRSPSIPILPLVSSYSNGDLLSSPRVRSSQLIRDHSLTKLSSKGPLISQGHLRRLWNEHSTSKDPDFLDVSKLPRYLSAIAAELHSIQCANTSSQGQLEHMNKVFDEYRESEELSALATVSATKIPRLTGTSHISFDAFRRYFDAAIYEKMIWQLSK